MVATIQALTTGAVPEPPKGSLQEVVAALEKHAGRKFRIAEGAKLPDVAVKPAARGGTVGEILHQALAQSR